MIEAAEANPKATMIASDALWVGAHDKEWKETREAKLRHGGIDLGQIMYKTKLFKQYGYFDPHPRAKHKYDWNLIEKFINMEGISVESNKIAFTHKPTFIMNYKKR